MRLIAALIATVLALPAAAQQISPLTGTTAGPGPAAAPPGAAAPGAAAPGAVAPGAAAPSTPAAPQAAPARPHRPSFRQRFEAANTTHDGKLTLDQAKAGRLNRVVTHFDAIDTGKKGYVTMPDIQAFNRAQRQAHRQPKPQ